ncbi:17965_t:CDS:2, partial [Dentiscutata erythropus]
SKLEALKENKDINIDQTRVLSGRGRKAMYPGLEKKLVDYIKKKREEKLAVTTSMIRKKAKKLRKTLDIRDAKFSCSWCDRFRKRHGLPRGIFPQDIIVAAAPYANMKGDLMISTYIPQAIRSRPNGFFKSKGIIFVDGHRSHVRDDVKKAFKAEGLDLLEIPGGTTSPFKNGVRQRREHWIDEGKIVLTKNGNRKKASYELVCEWVSKTWKEISPNILVRFFEAAGLMLNPDGSKNDKMSQCLQAIVQAVAKNRTNELNINELLDALPEDENESVMDVENQTDNEENTTEETDDENAMDYEYVTDDDERMIE